MQFVLSLLNFKHMWTVSVKKIFSWIKLLYSAPHRIGPYLERHCKFMWDILGYSSGAGDREICNLSSQCDLVCTHIHEDSDFHS